MYITLDGGTTNTRLSLVSGLNILQTIKINMGAGNCVNGNAQLKKEIKTAIHTLLQNNNIAGKDVKAIVASGMITSEYGLCALEHTTLPAGIEQLHNTMCEVSIEDITSIPFSFIRGVKMSDGTLETSDIMRGEETELMGLIDDESQDAVYVLPGSHSKLIYVNNGQITDFCTLMTGEMIAALSGNTILRTSFDLNNSTLVDEYLFMGYSFCIKNGVNKTLFKTRVLDTVLKCSKNETYSFFMGAVLCAEIENIINQSASKVVIGGNKNIRVAMGKLLRKFSNKEIVVLDDKKVNESTAFGAIRIYEFGS